MNENENHPIERPNASASGDRRRGKESPPLGEELFRELANTLPQIVWIADGSGKLQYVNRQWTDYAGLTLEQTRDYSRYSAVIHPDDIDRLDRTWAEALETESLYEVEIRIKRASDGVYRWFLTRAVPVRDERGRIAHWYGTSTDIDDRHRYEKTLRRLVEGATLRGGEFFRTLVRSLAETLRVRYAFICRLDPETGDRMRTIAGWMDGRPSAEFEYLLAGTPCERVIQQRDRFYRRGVARQFPEDRWLAEMGVESYLGTSLRGSDGRILGLLTVQHDRPIDESLQPEVLIRIFADQAAAEIERQQTEEALRQREGESRAITNSLPALISFIDAEEKYHFVNARYEEWFGRPATEVLGRSLAEVLGPAAYEIIRPYVVRVLAGETVTYKALLPYRGAPSRYVEATYIPRADRTGKIEGFVAWVSDIGDRVRAEEALRESEERLRLAQRAAGAGLWDWDIPGDRVTWSEEYYQLYGIDRSVTPSYGRWLESIEPTDRERVDRACLDALECRADLDVEFRIHHPTRGTRWLTAIGRTFYDVAGNPCRMTGIALDITERKQAELQAREREEEMNRLNVSLQRFTEELAKRNQELDRFAHVVSHDLKAPLRAIANLSVWIEDDLASEVPGETRHHLELLRKRVYRLENLIEGLLQYSRIGRFRVVAEVTDVGRLLEEAIDSLQPPSSFVFVIAPDLPRLFTKRLLLWQVFTNLISNAIKHHDRDAGRIEIAGRPAGDRYEFTVTDDGPGIAPEYHERIFQIFQTLQSRDERENTGIGLSIVRKIVETEGGKIEVESGSERGTTFRFTWPKDSADSRSGAIGRGFGFF